MLDFKNQMIHIPGIGVEDIMSWEVWFVTLTGLHRTLTDAKESCKEIGQDESTIIPIPVALGTTIFEPVLVRGITNDVPDDTLAPG